MDKGSCAAIFFIVAVVVVVVLALGDGIGEEPGVVVESFHGPVLKQENWLLTQFL